MLLFLRITIKISVFTFELGLGAAEFGLDATVLILLLIYEIAAGFLCGTHFVVEFDGFSVVAFVH